MKYYMLLPDNFNVGDTVTGEDPIAATPNQRAIGVTDAMDELGGTSDLAEIIQNGAARLVRVEPLGEVASVYIDGTSPPFECEDGWKVADVQSIHGLLGPQGEQIVSAVTTGVKLFESEDEISDSEQAIVDRYHEETDKQYEAYGFGVSNASRAAQSALMKHDVDDYWWSENMGCTWGNEVLALAARDLIDPSTDWNQYAYDMLTAPWRRSVGVLHSEDAVEVSA